MSTCSQTASFSVTLPCESYVRRVARPSGSVVESSGFEPLDALHLASAEEAKADYFCSCDDRLLKKAKSFPRLKVRVMSPIELAEEIDR